METMGWFKITRAASGLVARRAFRLSLTGSYFFDQTHCSLVSTENKLSIRLHYGIRLDL